MIIENKGVEYSKFLENWNSKESFVDVVYIDEEKHPLNTHVSLIFVKFKDADTYVLPLFHNEADCLDPSVIIEMRKSRTTKYTVDKKKLLYHLKFNGEIIDVSIRKYLKDNEEIDTDRVTTNAHDHVQSISKTTAVNQSIPILKHKERFEKLLKVCDKYLQGEVNSFYNDIVVETLTNLEKSGLYVDRDKFCGKQKHITKDNLVFTEYNLFTSTGRPSNRHGNVNYSALNKTDGTRNAFISRFRNEGSLVMFDFDAYHIRLIGELIGFDLPSTSAHKWLAEQYFDGEITDAEYEQAKALTFKMLYGGIDDEIAETVPFMKQADKFIDKLWETGTELGYIPTPISGRKIYLKHIDSVNRLKLFNYLLQLHETERNIEIIRDIIVELRNKKSKLVLYTYDSFLFDVHESEKEFITEILRKKIEGDKYPVHLSIGSSYNNMN